MTLDAPSSTSRKAVERPRRFYKTAAPAAVNGGFAVQLDGRGAKTPAGAPLVLPTEALAAVVAAEWEGQGETLDLAGMTATRLAFTAIDRTRDVHAEVARETARFAESDVLCYFAASPRSLVARQEAEWAPVLAWADAELGLRLHRTTGVGHVAQPPETLARIEALAAAEDDFALTGLASAAALYGSAVLALAVRRGVRTARQALDLSRLDERFQEEQWGVDAEAAARVAGLEREADALGAWLQALR